MNRGLVGRRIALVEGRAEAAAFSAFGLEVTDAALTPDRRIASVLMNPRLSSNGVFFAI